MKILANWLFLLTFTCLSVPGLANRPSTAVWNAYSQNDGSHVYLYDDWDNHNEDPERVQLWYIPSYLELDLTSFEFSSLGLRSFVQMEFVSKRPPVLVEREEDIRRLASEQFNVPLEQVYILPLPILESRLAPVGYSQVLFQESLQTPLDGFLLSQPLFIFGELDYRNRRILQYLVQQGLPLLDLSAKVSLYQASDGEPQFLPFTTRLDLRDLPICKLSPNGC